MKIERWNTPGTGETLENREGGILIVMPPQWGPVRHEGELPPKARGLITSLQIDRGPVIPELLRWLELSGIDVRKNAKAFSILVWPSERYRNCRGPEQISRLVVDREMFLTECRRRRPQLLIFLSCYLFDAAREPEVQQEMLEIFGKETEKSHRLCATRLRAEALCYEKALFLGLPLPGRNTTESFVTALSNGMLQILRPLRDCL